MLDRTCPTKLHAPKEQYFEVRSHVTTGAVIKKVFSCHDILTHWGRDKMDAIYQTAFSNAFSWMKMDEFRLRFHWSVFPRVSLTIFQHWFWQWLGADQATSHYLNQYWLDHWRIFASFGLNELKLHCSDAPFCLPWWCNETQMIVFMIEAEWNTYACLALSHYLKQRWLDVSLTFRDKLQWTTTIFIEENKFKNVVCKTMAIGEPMQWLYRKVH